MEPTIHFSKASSLTNFVLANYPDVEDYLGRIHSPFLEGLDFSPEKLRPEHIVLGECLNLSRFSTAIFCNWPRPLTAHHAGIKGCKVVVIDRRFFILDFLRALSFSNGYEVVEHAVGSKGVLDESLPLKPPILFFEPFESGSSVEEEWLGELVSRVQEMGGVAVAGIHSHRLNIAGGISDSFLSGSKTKVEKIWILPSLERPRLLIAERFLTEEPEAWRHLADLVNEDGTPRDSERSPMSSVWKRFSQYSCFPTNSASYLLVLSSPERSKTAPVLFDLIATSVGLRKPQFWSVATKERGRPSIKRHVLAFGKSTTRDKLESPSLFAHSLDEEDYCCGEKLSERWIDVLASSTGPDLFLDGLNKYFEFLKSLIKPGCVNKLDLIADNLVLDGSGIIRPIDQEWETQDEAFDPSLAFCRGILYFLIRYEGQLARLENARRIGPSFRQFVLTCCAKVELNGADLIEKLEAFETNFRRFAHNYLATIDFGTILYSRLDDRRKINLCCHLIFEEDSYPRPLYFSVPAVAAGFEVNLEVLYPPQRSKLTKMVIFADGGFGGMYIHSITATQADPGMPGVAVAGHRKILRLAENILAGERSEAAFSDTNRPIVKFELSLRNEIKIPTLGSTTYIKLSLSWPEIRTETGEREKLVEEIFERVWDKEINLEAQRRLIDELTEKISTLEKDLQQALAHINLLKSSKVWRTAEVIRKLVYVWLLRRISIRPQPTAAIEILSAPSIEPQAKLKLISEQLPRPPLTLSKKGEKNPLISIVIPVHNTPMPWLSDAIGSVMRQSYPHWQLVLVDDGSTLLETREFLDKIQDPRITLCQLTSSGGISCATNFGLEAARGAFVGFMDHDDMLASHALESVAREIRENNPDILYSDESTFSDRTEERILGFFGSPHLKPDYSPDLLLSHNYITHFLVVRKSLLVRVGGVKSEFDGAQDFDLILRLTEQTDRVTHISEVLYHWRQSPRSTSLDTGVKPEAHLRGKRALEEALVRRGIAGEVLMANAPHFFRVRRRIIDHPSIDIIIPFRDQAFFLHQCLDALLAKTRYDNYRVLCVDNGSTDECALELRARYADATEKIRFIELDIPFNFSELVNFGVANSRADHIVLMNNDIQVINNDWLDALLEHSQRSEIGAVGGKLFYPDDSIQHAGIVVGIGGYAGHPHKREKGGFRGYQNRLQVIQNVSAVTGALLMCKRRIFEEVNGFDATQFAVACNDVDFCLRLMEKGYRNIFTPYSLAYHHESISRGYEDTQEKQLRFAREKEKFRHRHSFILETGDPYYNSGLRLDTEDVVVRDVSASA